MVIGNKNAYDFQDLPPRGDTEDRLTALARVTLDREAAAHQLSPLPHADETYAGTCTSACLLRIEPFPIVSHYDL